MTHKFPHCRGTGYNPAIYGPVPCQGRGCVAGWVEDEDGERAEREEKCEENEGGESITCTAQRH